VTAAEAALGKRAFARGHRALPGTPFDAATCRRALRELRQAAGKTQEQVAAAARMKQSELSRAERREDHLLSTLRRYVKGLGGELEVVARVGRKVVRLRGV